MPLTAPPVATAFVRSSTPVAILTGTAPARKEAEQLRPLLLADVDRGRTAGGGKTTVAQLLERWLETADLELTTRCCCQQYIAAKITPAVGMSPCRKSPWRCSTASTPNSASAAAWRQTAGGDDDPPGPLRAALGLAAKWGWISTNPAEQATVPRYVRQDIAPPTPAQVARFVQAAWDQDPDLGTLPWLAVVTGARRGELCGLRWTHVRSRDGCILISRNLVHRGREVREKDTKTHQSRRVALDEVTAEILR